MNEESTSGVLAAGREGLIETLSRTQAGKFPREQQAEIIVGVAGSPPLTGEGIGLFPYLTELISGWYHETDLSSRWGEGFFC